jgi:hypothetical protein
MVSVKILKNGLPIKSFVCSEKVQQQCFEHAFNIAGGLWNGKDEFKVTVDKR